eukprot:5143219-Amphidinium_carterae.1
MLVPVVEHMPMSSGELACGSHAAQIRESRNSGGCSKACITSVACTTWCIGDTRVDLLAAWQVNSDLMCALCVM